MSRDSCYRRSLGSLHAHIKQSRVLMVGAGGIGCELLKNLVLTGFGEIHIVDLDTIDLSNLNRQFLFRHEHIKRSKALVAKESAGRFNPKVNIVAHHANIKDPNFNLDFFSSFALVFNALDNLDARRHVNRMCLAADVPLIESGTTGFNGQVQVIKRGLTECYDCNPKETPKSFPVCTIRSTPSQPIHCIVWAKSYLFAEIFGTSEDEAPDLDTTQDSDNAAEIEKLRNEAQALKRIRESMGSDEFPRQVFDKVYRDDIERLRSMEDMWRTRRKPEALDFTKLAGEAAKVDENIRDRDQSAWTASENFAVFVKSMKALSDRLDEMRANAEEGNATPVLSFDKDDKDTLDFVASAANLRSFIFGIALQSEFEIKRMAGNIIPAIATTNAMTASLCVLQSLHVLRAFMPPIPAKTSASSSITSTASNPPNGTTTSSSAQVSSHPLYKKSRTTFLTRSHDRILSSEPLRPPNPHCPICGVAHAKLAVDLTRATLRHLVEDLLQSQLAYTNELSVTTEAGVVFDPDLDDNLDKPLSSLRVGKDSSITITDESDVTENGGQPRVNLVLSVVAANTSEASTIPDDAPPLRLTETFEIKRKPPKPNEPTAVAQASKEGKAATEARTKLNGHVADGEAVEVEVQEKGLSGADAGVGGKRKRTGDDAGLEAEMARKRGRVMEERPGPVAVVKQNGKGAGDGDLDGEVGIEMDDGMNGQAGGVNGGVANGLAMERANGMSKGEGKGAQQPQGADTAFVLDDDGGAIVIDD